jgi:sugar phosphate isomerase/epimerase
MVELSINETTTFKWSFEEDVAQYAAAGIRAMGVWRQKLSDCGEAKAIELLKAHDMRVSHLLWAGGFTGSDGRSHVASIEDAREAMRTASALGAGVLLVYTGPRAGHTHNHSRRLACEALELLTPEAAERGITLALEPMHPDCASDFTFLTSLDDTLEFLDMVGSPRVKMVFDTYQLGQDPRVLDRLAEIAPHVALVHLGDARRAPQGEQNRCRLGEGSIPVCQIVDGLCQGGYDGFLDVELLGEDIETLDYRELIDHAKQVFDQMVSSCSR